MRAVPGEKKHSRGIRRSAIRCALCAALIAAMLLTGCGSRLVFTTGFREDEVISVGSQSAASGEVRLYISNYLNAYEDTFGSGLWDAAPEAAQTVRDEALGSLLQVKILNLMAERDLIALTDEEETAAAEAGIAYCATLTPEDREYIGLSETDIVMMMSEYAVSRKEYAHLTESADLGISDDEARVITIRTIRTETEDAAREAFALLAGSVAADPNAVSGTGGGAASFESVQEQYSTDPQREYTVSRADLPAAVEQAAFALESGAISGIVSAEDGYYYIILCLNHFDEAKTEANREAMKEKRLNEAFAGVYEPFLAQQDVRVNEELLGKQTAAGASATSTSSFFEVYDEYF